MPLDSPRENDSFQVTALLYQAGKLVVLGDAGDVLLDDGPFVQFLGYLMARRAYQFHSAREGRMVGSGASKRRQKRVMHIDDASRIRMDEPR